MGLRPTNSNEHHGGAPSLILKDFARDVRRSGARNLLFFIFEKLILRRFVPQNDEEG